MAVDLSMTKPKKSRSKLSRTLRNNLYMIKCLDEAKEDNRRGFMRCCSQEMCDLMYQFSILKLQRTLK